MTKPLTALVINCSLKPSPAQSSTDKLAGELLDQMATLQVAGNTLRAADYNIMPGVEKDMGEGDDWPMIRQQVLAADILVMATPTWMGHMTSIAQRVLERLDAELGEADDQGRYPTYGKVAVVVAVGNEDGAHNISADLFQGLNDVGYAIAPNAVTYWNGNAMGKIDYKDLDEIPEEVATATKMAAINTVHLANLLASQEYPAIS